MIYELRKNHGLDYDCLVTVSVKIYDNKRLAHKTAYIYLFITPPARRAWRSYKFAPFLFFFRVESRRTAHGWHRCA